MSNEQGKGRTHRWDLEADRALALQIQAGDEAAFRTLYRTHAPALLRRIIRMISDSQRAEDFLQQVFTEAFESIHRYRGEGPLFVWLNRITTYTMLDEFRRKQRWSDTLKRLWVESSGDLIEYPAIPEALFLQEETKQVVHRLLSGMDAHKRIVILLCDLEGLGIEEAAEELEVPVGTVASRLYRGRQLLKKRVTAELQRRGLSAEEWFHE